MGRLSAAVIERAKEYLNHQEDGNEREAVDVVFESDISTLEKVYALDKLYNCNLMLPESGYRQLSATLREIQPEIESASDPDNADRIVSKIAALKYGRKAIGNVFASKYCYFTRTVCQNTPRTSIGLFVIYDQYAAKALRTLRNGKEIDGTYKDYADSIRRLLQSLEVDYRDLDKYLWLLGQVLDACERERKTKRIE